MTETIPIILTKLQPPLVRRTAVPRERLAALMRGCAERRLTLACAAPGYGKTTLIASTLAELGPPVVWYSLSRSDRDPITFLSYLTQGFDRQWPGFAAAVSPAYVRGQTAAGLATAFVAACVNQLAATAADHFVLVLDDFQLVDQVAEIRQTLDLLISHAPPQAHFVIATRTAPPLPCLPRLRAQGDVVEIGELQLKFRPDEAPALFERCLGLPLPASTAAALVEQIEGWALGLLLAGQSIKGRGAVDVETLLPQTAADRRVLFDYLSEEVMRQQPPEAVDFLTSSAILSRLEPTLCDEALGRSDSAAQLHRLEQHCLFVARTEDGCLRYHRLFREFLLDQLAGDPPRLEALHRRAATHFEAHQDYETAIFHWLGAGDHRQAATLIAAVSAEMISAGRLDTVSYWLAQLPDGEFAHFPELWLRWGQMSEARGRWDQALEFYEQAAQGYRDRGDLLGLSDVLRSKGHILDWRKGRHAEAERLHREALGYVGEEHRRQRAALVASLSRDQLSAANTTAAQALYREALAIYEAEADRQGQLDTLLNPGSWLYHSLGDFRQALAVLRRAEQLALELRAAPQLAEACNNISVNLYFSGRHAEAIAYAEKALALGRELGDPHQEAFALFNRANGLEATCGMSYGDLYQQYQRALHMEQALGNRRFVIATLVFMMILARRGGDVSEAAQRGRQALALATERGLRWLTLFVLVQLGAAQIWTDPEAARDSLTEALSICGECGDLYHLTAAHFWLAVLHQSEDHEAYLDHLHECLRLAVGHHYDHFFQAEAQAAVSLLVAALEHDVWPSYVTPLLAKIGSRAVGSLRPLLSHPSLEVRRRAQAALDEMGAGTATAGARTRPAGRSRPAPVPPLTIRAFGTFRVWRGEHPIEEREWGRRKCKRLFKYVVLSPDHTVSKDAVVELLWGEADAQAANANFYRTLYNLRHVLEPLSPHSGANYLALEGGLLRLVEDAVENCDVDDFVRQAEDGHRLARIGDQGAWRRLTAALQLYADDLSTDDLYDDWLRPRRELLRDLYVRALCDLADLAATPDRMDLAVGHLRRAFRQDATSETVCMSLMVTLARSGHRAEALQHYAACEKALAELGLAPSPELRAAQLELTEAAPSAVNGG